MSRFQSRRQIRSAFTLIELLVVIAIIAILVSLTAAAVMKVLGNIPKVQTSTEIGEMDQAMASFMAAYGLQSPPPSMLSIHENGAYNPTANPLDAVTVKFFQRCFGKTFNVFGPHDWNGDSNTNESYILSGQQCLVFYLGGIPTYTTNGTIGMTGFAMNNAHPAAPTPGSTRNGPFFNFKSSKLVLVNNFPVYMDPWNAKPKQSAYAFFSSQGKVNGYNAMDCGGVAYPYYQLTTSGLPDYANNNRYQIISAGLNGIFGGTTNHTAYGVAWNPAGGATGAGADDQSNFSSSILGAGQH